MWEFRHYLEVKLPWFTANMKQIQRFQKAVTHVKDKHTTEMSRELLSWGQLLVSLCCKQKHIMSAEAWIRSILPLPSLPALTCTQAQETSVLLWTRLSGESPAALLICEKSGPNFTDILRRLCLKTALQSLNSSFRSIPAAEHRAAQQAANQPPLNFNTDKKTKTVW